MKRGFVIGLAVSLLVLGAGWLVVQQQRANERSVQLADDVERLSSDLEDLSSDLDSLGEELSEAPSMDREDICAFLSGRLSGDTCSLRTPKSAYDQLQGVIDEIYGNIDTLFDRVNNIENFLQ